MSTAAADAVARVIATGFRGRATKLVDIDLPRLGHEIGVGEDELHAFLDVETAGGGFDRLGRPKALYEPHRAYALSTGAIRAAFVSHGLAYPKWGEKPYPTDSYARVTAAIAIEPRIALEATSWGLGQILGSNHVAAGYESAAEMVSAFLDGEAPQLAGAVSFIKVNRLDDELRSHNWAAFARGYNGPAYAANHYDTKLAAAYAKWAKIKDTAWSPGMAGLQAIAAAAAPAMASPEIVARVEKALASASEKTGAFQGAAPPSAPAPTVAKPLPPIVPPPPASLGARFGAWIDRVFA